MIHPVVDVLAQGLPIPDPGPSLPPQVGQTAGMFISWLKGLLLIACWAGLLFSAIMIGVGVKNRRQASQEGVFGVGWSLLGLAVGGASYALSSMLPV